MTLRSSLIEKEVDNRINVLTWADVMAAINALFQNEKDLIINALTSDRGSVRQVIAKQIRQTIRQAVITEVDGYIVAGSVPLTFLDKIIE
jgi:hypothetical protein